MSSGDQPAANLSDKVAVLTTLGADAVGEEIVAQLLLNGVGRLYILTATEQNFAAILDELSIRQDLSLDSLNVEHVPCDLSSIQSCGDAAKSLLKRLRDPQRLDLFFCHASTPASDGSSDQSGSQSPDGVDPGIAVGYLSHYVLLNMLLPLIELTARQHQEARVVVSTSYLYTLTGSTTLDAMTSKSDSDQGQTSSASTNAITRYSRLQLAKILFARYFAKLENADKGFPIYCNSFDATDIQPDLLGESAASIPAAIFRKSRSGPEGAAAAAMFLASDPSVASNSISGQYFDSSATPNQLEGVAEDKDLRNNLWYWSDHKVSEVLRKGWADFAKGMVGDDASAAAEQ